MDRVQIESVCIAATSSIRQAIACIDRNQHGIVLVVNAERRLLGTITDGDVRRAVLAGQDLEAPVAVLLARKPTSPYSQPVTAPLGTPPDALLQLMQERVIRQVPLLDDAGRVAGLCTIDELLPQRLPPLQAVVMAGGFGARLQPLTDELPKPMLPVGDRPLMEHIVTQLRDAGIRQVSISTHYKPEAIVQHFGDGQKFGVHIDYVNEERPLGTAGALGLMPPWTSTLLVMNGDILTRLNYQSMLVFHQENRAVATVGVRQYDFQVPYGVVETDGVHIRRLSEKPRLQFFVNAGVYLLEPAAHQYIPHQERCDMTDLIDRLLADGRPIVSFPISEYWLDIGQHADYEKAQADFREGEGSR